MARPLRSIGVVTGATRELGLACATRLAGTVDTLLLADSDAEGVRLLAKGIEGAEPIAMDVADAGDAERLAARVAELGTLRAVVHGAELGPSEGDWRRVLQVNLTGTVRVAEALRPLAAEGTAHVVFGSVAPMLAITGSEPAVIKVLDEPLAADFTDRLLDALGASLEDTANAYTWAKLGVQRFARAEAVRLGPAGARICSISPGVLENARGKEGASPLANSLVRRTPLGRKGKPEEIAAVAAFALSAEAGFLTGTDLVVDGGMWAAQRR